MGIGSIASMKTASATSQRLDNAAHPPRSVRLHTELERVYRAHSDQITRYLRRRCGSHELADDLASLTFEAAARRLTSDPAAEISPAWLMCVAKRRLFDHWRRRECEGRALARLTAGVDLKAPEAFELQDLGELANQLADLPDHYRDALVLRYVSGEPVGVIARHLGLSYRAAESVLARARLALRQAASAERELVA